MSNMTGFVSSFVSSFFSSFISGRAFLTLPKVETLELDLLSKCLLSYLYLDILIAIT